MEKKKQKIILAFDGGIDASVAGYLLSVQNYDVMAVHVQIWPVNKENVELPKVSYNCAGIAQGEQLIEICRKLKIPLKIISLEDVFQDKVISQYIHSKLALKPFLICNYCINNVILRGLLSITKQFDAEKVATGHYARITYNKLENHYSVWQSKNLDFDSSRCFYDFKQEELAKLKFPIGDLSKKEISILAERFEITDIVLPRNEKKEACFLYGKKEISFLESRVSERIRFQCSGEVVDSSYRVLKKHENLYQYKVGEKKPTKIGGKKNKFVIAADMRRNIVMLGGEEDLKVERILLHRVNLISIPRLGMKEEFALLRVAGGSKLRCTIEAAQDNKLIINFYKPEIGFWRGVEVVLYDNHLLLGGGVVESVLS